MTYKYKYTSYKYKGKKKKLGLWRLYILSSVPRYVCDTKADDQNMLDQKTRSQHW